MENSNKILKQEKKVSVLDRLSELIIQEKKCVSNFLFETKNFKKNSEGKIHEETVISQIKGTLKSYSDKEVVIKMENGEIKTFETNSLKDLN